MRVSIGLLIAFTSTAIARAVNIMFEVQDIIVAPANLANYCQNDIGEVVYSTRDTTSGLVENFVWDHGNIAPIPLFGFNNQWAISRINNTGGATANTSNSIGYLDRSAGWVNTLATNWSDSGLPPRSASYGISALNDNGWVTYSENYWIGLRSYNSPWAWHANTGAFSIGSSQGTYSISLDNRVALFTSGAQPASARIRNLDSGSFETLPIAYELAITPNGNVYRYYSDGKTKRLANGTWQPIVGDTEIGHIIDRGWSYGGSSSTGYTFWDDEVGARPLQGLITSAGWTITSIRSMNQNGEILARASYEGTSHIVRLNPLAVPEPTTLAGFIAVLGLLKRRATKPM